MPSVTINQNVLKFLAKFLFSVSALVALSLTVLAAPVAAQTEGRFWIQIESKDNIRETKERAQFFARSFADTHAFQTTSGWYALAIGPMSQVEAADELARLKAGNLIPNDSFLSDGATFRAQLWPLAANTGTETAAVSDPVVVEEPVAVVEEPAVVVEEPATNDTTAEVTTVATTTPVVEETPVGPIPDEDLNATKKLERTWTRDQKKEYQTYMVWTGDYESAIDGSYGRGTRKAIKDFQEREGYEDTGFLTEGQLALLQKRYDDIIGVLGLGELRDLDAGVQIDYPSKLVKFERFEPPFVHYKAKSDSGVRMMLISQEGGRAMLASLYDIMETFDFIPAEGYRVRKRDWFVLSGRNDDVVSYSYVRTDRKTVKGFTLVWPPERDTEMQPLATAMYNSFTPLKEYVLDETLGYGQDDDQPMDLTSGLETPEPDRSASGFFINASGVVLTHTANIEGCKRVTLGATGVELALTSQNEDLGLAVLRPVTSFTPQSYALFSAEPPELGSEITIAGFSFPEVMEIATLNYGTLTDTDGMLGKPSEIRISAFLEQGDTGGPVLDDRGAVIGMRLMKSPQKTGLPEYVNFALKSSEIMALLEQQNLTFGKSTAFDAVHSVDLAFMAGDFTVKVSCWE